MKDLRVWINWLHNMRPLYTVCITNIVSNDFITGFYFCHYYIFTETYVMLFHNMLSVCVQVQYILDFCSHEVFTLLKLHWIVLTTNFCNLLYATELFLFIILGIAAKHFILKLMLSHIHIGLNDVSNGEWGVRDYWWVERSSPPSGPIFMWWALYIP